MNLPEIRFYVAQYLLRSEHATCSQVCKSWYDTFNPLVWSRLVWDHLRPNLPPESSVVHNAHHIRILVIQKIIPRVFPIMNRTHLKQLDLVFQQGSAAVWQRLSSLIQQNPELEELTNVGNNTPSTEFFRALKECCPSFKRLKLSFTTLYPSATRLLLDMASAKLEFFWLMGDTILGPKNLDPRRWGVFPHVTSLGLEFHHGMSIQQQLTIIQRCPRLKSLFWSVRTHTQNKLPVSEISALFESHCPLLEDLQLLDNSLTDLELATIVEACPVLRKLKVPDTGFGVLAFQALNRHFAILNDLNVMRCIQVTSLMVEQILDLCPELRDFHGPRLCAHDIFGVLEEEDDQGDGEGSGRI